MVEIYETWQGWQVRQGTKDRWRYVSKVYNGQYTFNRDYLYAKNFTEKAAKKHKAILERMETR